MLPINDINNLRLLSKKFYQNINKYTFRYYTYLYDNNFIETLKYKDIQNLKLKAHFNQDISSLTNSFPNLTNLHLGCYFNQDISSLANSFHNLTNLHLGMILIKTYQV